MKNKLLFLYENLLKKHGYQGWWPINEKYFPGDYNHPYTEQEVFEIAIGAILTQNTNWKNAEKALTRLHENSFIGAEDILKISNEELASLIKSAGYYNQKTKKIKEFTEFYIKNKTPSREKLLEIWGIGKETADSILLYAYKQPIFIIDTYTKKVMKKYLKIEIEDYDSLQKLFHKNLPNDYKLYNEFHALFVAEGKML